VYGSRVGCMGVRWGIGARFLTSSLGTNYIVHELVEYLFRSEENKGGKNINTYTYIL